MSTKALILCMALMLFLTGLFALGAYAVSSDDQTIHIDDHPAYACIGEGC